MKTTYLLSLFQDLRPPLGRARWRGVLSLVALLALRAVAAEPKPQEVDPDMIGTWEFAVDPNLPNVLLIGDSISVSYTRPVRDLLHGKANVFRPMSANGKTPANCGDTRLSLGRIDEWLAGRKWDVIHFNWGLHDCCYRNPAVNTPGHQDKVNGTISIPSAEYESNLEQLVSRLEKTGAVLVWATTTVIPENDVGRFVGDDVKYNQVAAAVMTRHGVRVDDLHTVTAGFKGKYSLGPGDVHFRPEGSARIAREVAAAIQAALPAAVGGRTK